MLTRLADRAVFMNQYVQTGLEKVQMLWFQIKGTLFIGSDIHGDPHRCNVKQKHKSSNHEIQIHEKLKRRLILIGQHKSFAHFRGEPFFYKHRYTNNRKQDK